MRRERRHGRYAAARAAPRPYDVLVAAAELLDGAGSATAGVLAGPVLRSLQQGPFTEVTPFGRYALARVLRGHGLTVPTPGDLVGTPPGELLEALYAHDPAAAAEEIRGWLDARGEDWESAVRDVVRSARPRCAWTTLRRGRCCAEWAGFLDDRKLAARLRRGLGG